MDKIINNNKQQQKIDKKRDYVKEVKETSEYLIKNYPIIQKCNTVIVCGSGLADLVSSKIENPTKIPYSDIPNWKTGGCLGHSNLMLIGTLKSHPEIYIMCLQGRIHVYEGYSAYDVSAYVRVLKEIGLKNLVLTNACGSCNPEMEEGDIMLLKDHINLMGVNPLIGTSFKPMFVDMSNCYDKEIRFVFKQCAMKNNINIHEGVYVAMTGPSYETRAEYKMYAVLGGDVAGMSTIPECIVANQIGLRVCGISIIGNLGLNLYNKKPEINGVENLHHNYVLEKVSSALPRMIKILDSFLPLLEKM